MLQTCRTILFFGLLPCSGRKALLMANKGWNFSDEARFSLSITVPKLTAALSGLLLAACSGQQASLEDRVINVESDAIPASASPAPDMSGLLRQTSPSYVTIT